VATRKPAWHYRQSGLIPVRRCGDGLEVLLVTNRKQKRWVIPKGIVDLGLSPLDSAVKEAWEEAGVRGNPLTQPLGEYQYRKWGGTCRVVVFLLWVEDIQERWPESGERLRAWLTIDEAAARVREEALATMIREVRSVRERRDR
jgi:8-oxo-dGTP pyrophosphatase MutT (NUDIX family)